MLYRAERCPRCGSTLNTNGVKVWCTFIGGATWSAVIPACRFGIDQPEPLPTLAEVERLRGLVELLADRVFAQSELLGKRAESETTGGPRP